MRPHGLITGHMQRSYTLLLLVYDNTPNSTSEVFQSSFRDQSETTSKGATTMGKKKEYTSMEDIPSSDDNFDFEDLKDDDGSFNGIEDFPEFSIELSSGDMSGFEEGRESSSSLMDDNSKRSNRPGALERRRSRRSIRNQSPSAIATTSTRTRRCDRGRQDRVRKSVTGPSTPTKLQGRRAISNSPHALRRTRTAQPRRRNSGGVLVRSNQPRRSQSADPDDTAEALQVSPSEASNGEEKIGRHSRRSVMRKRNKSPGSLSNLNTNVSMLYSGGESLHTPDLSDGDDEGDEGDEFVEDIAEYSDDGAELVRDELADIEGLVEAAKGVSVSS
eukprot:scaffold54_cov110-Cylindrotheca_fusiformis.AAC.2